MFPKTNFYCLNLTKFSKINYQSVRYGLRYKRKEPFRKPVWQPIAPSKLYRIKNKEKLSDDEIEQRKHLEYTYEIDMKSIKEFLRKEFYLPTLDSEHGNVEASAILEKEDEELQKAIEENNILNEKISKMREERLKEFKKELESSLLIKKIQQEENDRRIGEEFDRLVRIEIERSKTYITEDNIDAKIEEALTHQTNYDYAIDIDGRIFFDGSLHPYALKPKAVPETSSLTEEYQNLDPTKPIYLKAKKLY